MVGLDLKAVSGKDNTAGANGRRDAQGLERNPFAFEPTLLGSRRRRLRGKGARNELGCVWRTAGVP
jgi:hypothetical protein